MADLIIVNRQILENFRGVRLQPGQELLVLSLVEEFALLNGPRVAQVSFGIGR